MYVYGRRFPSGDPHAHPHNAPGIMTAALSTFESWALLLLILSWIALATVVAHLTIELRHARALNRAWSYSLSRQRTP